MISLRTQDSNGEEKGTGKGETGQTISGGLQGICFFLALLVCIGELSIFKPFEKNPLYFFPLDFLEGLAEGGGTRVLP